MQDLFTKMTMDEWYTMITGQEPPLKNPEEIDRNRKPYNGPTAEDLDRKCNEVQQARELDEKFGENK